MIPRAKPSLRTPYPVNSHYPDLDNFSGALLGLRLSPLLIASASRQAIASTHSRQTSTAISECFVQGEQFLRSPQSFTAQLTDSNSLLNIVLPLLRYCHDELSLQLRRMFASLSHQKDTAYLVPACLALADALSIKSSPFLRSPVLSVQSRPIPTQQNWVSGYIRDHTIQHTAQYKLSATQSRQYSHLWQTIFALTAEPGHATNPTQPYTADAIPTEQKCYAPVILGISSACLHPQSYVLAVTQATPTAPYPNAAIAPSLAGLIVGSWMGPAAIPLLLQLQIDDSLAGTSRLQTASTPKETVCLPSRTYCQTIAKTLFEQWSGRRYKQNTQARVNSIK